MSRTKSLLAAAVGVTLMASAAQATITASLVPIQISAGAKTDDPALNSARSYDLVISQTTEHWSSTDLQTTLQNATFYTPSNGDSQLSQSSTWGTTGTRNLQYDTFITGPDYIGTSDANHLTVLGGATYPVNHGNTYGVGVGLMNSTTADIAWGDQHANTSAFGSGNYTVARLTVLGAGGANVQGRDGDTTTGRNGTTFSLYLPLAGDVDHDRIVGLSDLNLVEGALGTNVPTGTGGDADNDGIVGLSDLNLVEGALGTSLPAPGPAAEAGIGAVVPEPTSTLVLASALGIFGISRRGRRASA